MDYSKVTIMEYQEKKRKIFESLGAVKGDCKGTSLICDDCPFLINTYTRKCGVSGYNEQYHTKEAVKLVMDYEIPIDWKKVEVDTPILVRGNNNNNWYKRHFAYYRFPYVYAFKDGCTNFSVSDKAEGVVPWEHAKLANIESEEHK